MLSELNCTIIFYCRLSSLSGFADQKFAAQLQADLNNKDDSKRTLKELSAVSANQIFTVLGLDDPNCDANGDSVIKGDELKCLNFAWKAYVPRWSVRKNIHSLSIFHPPPPTHLFKFKTLTYFFPIKYFYIQCQTTALPIDFPFHSKINCVFSLLWIIYILCSSKKFTGNRNVSCEYPSFG